MSHVASQVRSEALSYEKLKRREACVVSRNAETPQRYNFSRPKRGLKHPGANSLPNISLPPAQEALTRESAIFHPLRPYSEYSTPTSAVSTVASSIFDLPSTGPWETPTTPTHCILAAELEDTSVKTVSKEVHRDSPPTVLPFRNTVVIDQNNQDLLERVVAAEAAAEVLRQQNTQLQRFIAAYKEQQRPQTAPSSDQFSIKTRSSCLNSPSGPISIFSNRSFTSIPLPSPPKTPSPLGPTRLNIKTSPPKAPLRSKMPATPPTTPTRRTHRRPPPILVSHFATNYEVSSSTPSISSPIAGTIVRHPVTFGGTPLSKRHPVSTISLADAQRRAKPLPYLMVLSPSTVHGFVEMEARAERSAWDTETVVDSETEGAGRVGWEWKRRTLMRGLLKLRRKW